MRFRTDDRGVTVQIGTVLLFAVLIVLLSTYQATVVPQENEEVEFNHNQRAQGELQDLRDELRRTAVTESDGSSSVALGTRYPVRAFFVNPPPPSGSLETTPPANATVRNATAVGETGDYWDGSARNFSTRGLVYEPNYHVYGNPPTTVYRSSVLYNRFAGANRTLGRQRLVEGNAISLVALNGSYAEAGSGSATVDLQTVSPAVQTVTVENETANVSVVVPTERPADEWAELLADEMNESEGDDRYVLAVEDVLDPNRNAVRVVLEPATYELQLAKVGVGSDITHTGPHYVTDVRGDNASVAENSQQELVVEVRDRFNNPVSGALVNATLASPNRNLSGDAIAAQGSHSNRSLTNITTDSDGRVTVRYDAPADFDDENERIAVNVSIAAVPDGPGFASSSPTNLSFDLTAVNADGSGLGGGGGGSDTYRVDWTDASGAGLDCDAEFTACTLNANDGTSVDLTANVTEDGDPVSLATVDYALDESDFGELSPTVGITEDGHNGTTLDVPAENGTVTAYAASGDDVDPITVQVVRSGDGPTADLEVTMTDDGPGDSPDTYELDAAGSTGDIVEYRWDHDADGTVEETTTVPTTTVDYSPGDRPEQARVVVVDADDRTDEATAPYGAGGGDPSEQTVQPVESEGVNSDTQLTFTVENAGSEAVTVTDFAVDASGVTASEIDNGDSDELGVLRASQPGRANADGPGNSPSSRFEADGTSYALADEGSEAVLQPSDDDVTVDFRGFDADLGQLEFTDSATSADVTVTFALSDGSEQVFYFEQT